MLSQDLKDAFLVLDKYRIQRVLYRGGDEDYYEVVYLDDSDEERTTRIKIENRDFYCIVREV